MNHRVERRYAWLMLAPSLVLLAAMAAYPVLFCIWLSLRRRTLVFGEDYFVGVSNYQFLTSDARFWGALGHTLYFATVAVTCELILGTAFAWLLHHGTRRQRWLRAAILVPWAIPTVVSAKLWASLYEADHGVLKRLTAAGTDLLASPGSAMHAAIVVDVWKTTPFVTLIVLAGLKTISQDVYRAGAVDGATAGQLFWSVELPLIRGPLAVAAVLRGLDAFRVFDAVYVLTGGGPANATESLSIYAYKMLMRAGDFGYGSTLAVGTFVCVAVLGAMGYAILGRARST
jgi:multiple sugar transport system permease protein